MECPYCGAENKSRVVDTTRDSQGGIRRRRECKICERRFSTYERVLRATPLLIKSNGDREAFDREKLIGGIQIACAKRPIPAAGINDLVHRIETHLQGLGKDEVSSRVVGDMVIEGLKELDPIAYIRYAIVYLGLDSLASVRDMLDSLLAEPDGKPGGKPASKPSGQPAPAATDQGQAADADGSADVPSDSGSKPPAQARDGPETDPPASPASPPGKEPDTSAPS